MLANLRLEAAPQHHNFSSPNQTQSKRHPPPSLAQWKRAGEGCHCLRAAPTRTIRSILLCSPLFPSVPSPPLRPSPPGQRWSEGIWQILCRRNSCGTVAQTERRHCWVNQRLNPAGSPPCWIGTLLSSCQSGETASEASTDPEGTCLWPV